MGICENTWIAIADNAWITSVKHMKMSYLQTENYQVFRSIYTYILII